MRKMLALLGTIVLTLGLLIGVAPAMAQAAAPPAAPATDGTRPMKQETFTVRGKIGTKVSRPVVLQVWRSGAWKNQARGKTTRKGTYSFKLSTSANSVKVRVVAARTRIHGKTYRKVISRSRVIRTTGQKVSVSASSIMAVGKASAVVAKIDPIREARPILLQANSGSGWTTVSTARSNAYGAVDFTFTPSAAGTISLRAVMAAWHNTPAAISTVRSVTVVPVGHDTAIQVATGATHTCALTSAGTVSCWGPSNGEGQLGNGSIGRDYTTYPSRVVGLPDSITAITAGEYHTCALASDHTVWCWGLNEEGELGNQSTTSSGTPVKVKDLNNVIAIEAGDRITCAVVGASPTATSGAAQCWGANDRHLLGDGSTVDYRLTPQNVTGLSSGVTSISLGLTHACATTVSGTAQCWGRGLSGELGNGQQKNSRTPVAVRLTGVTMIAAGRGGIDSGGETCAKTAAGPVWCWGSGYLGDGTKRTAVSMVKVTGLSSNVSTITLGDIACAVDNGAAKCWGPNSVRQLGDGTKTNRLTPTAVKGLTSGVASLSSTRGGGYARSYVTTTTGAVKWWGISQPVGYFDASWASANTPQNVPGFG